MGGTAGENDDGSQLAAAMLDGWVRPTLKALALRPRQVDSVAPSDFAVAGSVS
jgi:hypothetical protein